MKPTLFVLAAGMGSRYGGLKQLDGVGPQGQTIMDYSIYDAIRAGFGKVVFVIRKDFESDFRSKILSKYEGHVPVEVVFQGIDKLPEGYTAPEGRVKPWGTNHAVLMGREVIREPFAVINADDFYGREGFEVIGRYLASLEGSRNEYCMVGYEVSKTLSENGTVSRGVCEVDSEGCLAGMVERTKIERVDGTIVFHEGDEDTPLAENTPVSMNLFGFTPDYFEYSDSYFRQFLTENGADIKAEFYIPLMVNKLIGDSTARMRVLNTASQWFGVTYKEDRPQLVSKIEALIADGVYPRNLWK